MQASSFAVNEQPLSDGDHNELLVLEVLRRAVDHLGGELTSFHSTMKAFGMPLFERTHLTLAVDLSNTRGVATRRYVTLEREANAAPRDIDSWKVKWSPE